MQICTAFRLLGARPGHNLPQLTAVLLVSGLLDAAVRDLPAGSQNTREALTAAQVCLSGVCCEFVSFTLPQAYVHSSL